MGHPQVLFWELLSFSTCKRVSQEVKRSVFVQNARALLSFGSPHIATPSSVRDILKPCRFLCWQHFAKLCEHPLFTPFPTFLPVFSCKHPPFTPFFHFWGCLAFSLKPKHQTPPAPPEQCCICGSGVPFPELNIVFGGGGGGDSAHGVQYSGGQALDKGHLFW